MGYDGGLQGKRAVSDHMNEAVNYIKCLKRRIQELSVKRDKLKSNLSALDQESACPSDNCGLINCVAVNFCWGGVVEIVIKSGFGDWNLSTIMQVILEEGLDVLGCVSSQTNEGVLHTIQSQVYICSCSIIHSLRVLRIFKYCLIKNMWFSLFNICQVTDPTQLDLLRLQSKLNDLIISYWHKFWVFWHWFARACLYVFSHLMIYIHI